jgi:hypothetical protein
MSTESVGEPTSKNEIKRRLKQEQKAKEKEAKELAAPVSNAKKNYFCSG